MAERGLEDLRGALRSRIGGVRPGVVELVEEFQDLALEDRAPVRGLVALQALDDAFARRLTGGRAELKPPSVNFARLWMAQD